MEQLETAKIEVEKPFGFDQKDPAVLDAEPEQSEEPPERKCASRER